MRNQVNGHDCLLSFSPMIREKILENVNKHYKKNSEFILNDAHESAPAFLRVAFAWADTSEGADYWLGIYESIL